ncbi:hypothetical protein R5R35_001293 [Gryllus longicercus]|uniref:Delta-sarcoglycan n=1 Tax=Gryllus longicercus TaxID=2509291 RepID=A0AAN9Z7N1_9ORTH
MSTCDRGVASVSATPSDAGGGEDAVASRRRFGGLLTRGNGGRGEGGGGGGAWWGRARAAWDTGVSGGGGGEGGSGGRAENSSACCSRSCSSSETASVSPVEDEEELGEDASGMHAASRIRQWARGAAGAFESAAASNGPHSGKPPEKSAVNVASNRMARGEALSGAEWTDEASGGGGAAPPRYSFKVGIYGWRKRCLYLLILGLLVMVIVNLALTLWVLKVMEFSSEGMGQLRIVAGGVQLRGQALVLDALLASSIRSRYGQPLVLESSRNFTVNARGPDGRVAGRIFLGGDRVDCLSRSFRVTDARGATLFSADSREVVVGAEALRVTGEGGAIFDGTVQTPLVKADSGNELRLESPTRSLEVRAPLGVAIESRAGSISASCLADLKLQSLAGAVWLDAPNVFVPGLKKALPVRPGLAARGGGVGGGGGGARGAGGAAGGASQHLPPQPPPPPAIYQLCVCSNGKLFLAPPEGLCAADEDSDVCR